MSETPRKSILDLARNAANARMTKDNLRHVLQNVIDYAAALEAERHTTNEALSDAAEQLRANRDRIAELETFALGCDAEGCILPHSSWCEQAKKTAAENDGCTCGKQREGHPQPHAAHCWIVNPPHDELEWMRARIVELRAKLAEYERPADEDPIAYALTEQVDTEVFVPRTEREHWVTIANALNAAHAAGMPVGIDLDGTLTDHRMWSVVWDREAEQWTVAGYEDAETGGA